MTTAQLITLLGSLFGFLGLQTLVLVHLINAKFDVLVIRIDGSEAALGAKIDGIGTRLSLVEADVRAIKA